MLHASPYLIRAECPALLLALEVEIHISPERPVDTDSTVGEAWKEYVFPVREGGSA